MFQIDFSARIPIYEQLYYNVIKLASAGVIKPGDKLPPVRVIAAELGINPNTAAKAYRDKLDEHSAQRLVVLKEFSTAAKNAATFGAEKSRLIEIVEEQFKNK